MSCNIYTKDRNLRLGIVLWVLMSKLRRIQKLPVIWDEYAKFDKKWPTVCSTHSFTKPGIRWQLKSCWISSGTNTMAKHSNLPPHKKLQPWIRWCNWKLMDYKIFWHLILKESKDPVSQSQAIVRTVSTLNFLWFLTIFIKSTENFWNCVGYLWLWKN